MSKRASAFSAAFLAAALPLSGACVAPATRSGVDVTRTFYLMGTSLEVAITAPTREAGIEAAEAAFRAVQQAESRLSTWRRESELSELNRGRVGQVFSLSPLLDRDLRSAHRIARLSDFAFNPWTGPLIRAWGLRGVGRKPSRAELKAALRASAPDAFAWSEHGIVKKRAGALFEEGGFGKGVGLDDALEALARNVPEESSRAVLNFGGQLAVYGKGSRVPVDVAVPTERGQVLLRFETGPGSVATSGNSEHPGHLLDPETGRPIRDSGSVTVIADSGAEADALTKAIFVKGPVQGIRWANRLDKRALWITAGSRRGGPRWVARVSCAWGEPPQALAKDTVVLMDCSRNLVSSSPARGARKNLREKHRHASS